MNDQPTVVDAAAIPFTSWSYWWRRNGVADMPGSRYLHGPLADFLCLGGASLLLLPAALLIPNATAPVFAVPMFVIMSLVNHPHFAHSYQIFYRDFVTKASRANGDIVLRWRYLLAGVVVPLLLACILAGCIAMADLRLLGYCGNAMAFLVGWHYVKQGYGILMVDAALKRRFFSMRQKRILRANAYMVWITSWITANVALHHNDLWGVEYFFFAFPPAVLWVSWSATAASGAVTVWMLATHCRTGRQLPVAGLIAYGVSLYLWQLFVVLSPVWLAVVPSLHSLQYLSVVWRYEINRAKGASDAVDPAESRRFLGLPGRGYQRRFADFLLAGIVFGAALFWGAPLLLEGLAAHSRAAGKGLVFLFAAWVFVNVHHYFIDNVIWRSENPETRKYLFT
jgi:hypothetical protein